MKFAKFALLSAAFLFLGLLVTQAQPVGAACEPLPSDKGQATGSLTVPADGDYTLWARTYAPSADKSGVFVQIGGVCKATVGDNQPDIFAWQRVERLTLTKGTHQITVAGNKEGAGADVFLLASDANCTPANSDGKCLTTEQAQAIAESAKEQTEAAEQAQTAVRQRNWILVGSCAAIVLAGIGFLGWKYFMFTKKVLPTKPLQMTASGQPQVKHHWRQKIVWFIEHHPIAVSVTGVLILAALTVGVVAAAEDRPTLEAEKATLSGGAKVVQDGRASAGEYVVFDKNPASTTSNQNQTTTGSSGTTTQNSGGGGTTSTGWACALPKYPVSGCTGVPAGWSPQTTVNGDLVITESFIASKPNRTLENYLVTGVLDVRANNVTIRNTRVYGRIDNFVTNTVYGPMLIEDSEVVLPTGQTVSDNYESAIGVANFTCVRCKVTGRAEAWRVGASSYPGAGPVTIKDSYAKLQVTQAQCDAVDPHGDGIQGYGGNFATIQHNTIDQRDDPCPTAPIFIPDQDNEGANVTDNLLAGGGYSLRLWGGNFPTVTGNKIVNATYGYGPVDVDCSLIGTWSGNARVTYDWAAGVILSQVASLDTC